MRIVNNRLIFIIFHLFYSLYGQIHYLKPVHFFDYDIILKDQKYFIYPHNEFANITHYIIDGDTLRLNHNQCVPISKPNLKTLWLNEKMQNVFFTELRDFCTTQFIDTNQVLKDYLNHNYKYQNSGFKEILIYRGSTPPALPPHLFAKISNNFLYVGTLCSLDYKKIHPNDILWVVNQVDTCLIPVFSEQYPELSLQDSIYAMVYILTRKEFKFLNKIQKKAYLNFIWSGFDEESKMNLKALYFKRVHEANKWFYAYKEGWKTDKGMIYIIFGKPDAITIYPNYEDWFYENTQLNTTPVFFRFVKKKEKNVISYQLERNIQFYERWQDAVDAWRNGLIIKSNE